jgi:peptidoglycan hydrolase-like protein with peptidoglycan-binding domain
LVRPWGKASSILGAIKTATLPRSLVTAAAALAVGVTASSCTSARGTTAAAKPTVTTSTTTQAPSTTASTTTTTAKPIPPGLGVGSKGADVLTLEQRLTDLHYDAGKVDGVYDQTTAYAVTAFQKVLGLPRSGRATADVVKALATAVDPPAMLPAGGANRVEVDIKRQVLFLYKNGSLLRILTVSTGSGKRYCVDGECDYAVTPGGSFRVTWKMQGIRVSKLGKLWNPLFFNGGIAIHGEPAVPAYPASHGCVRIPMSASLWFYQQVPVGTPVYVLGGKTAPVPFNEPAPNQAPSTSSTTATTLKPTTTTSSSTTTTTSSSSTTTTTTL